MYKLKNIYRDYKGRQYLAKRRRETTGKILSDNFLVGGILIALLACLIFSILLFIN